MLSKQTKFERQALQTQLELEQRREQAEESLCSEISLLSESGDSMTLGDASKLNQKANELLALSRDPVLYFSVKDAETLYMLLDSSAPEQLRQRLLEFVAKNHQASSMAWEFLNQDSEHLKLAFNFLPPSKELSELAKNSLENSTNIFLAESAAEYLVRHEDAEDLAESWFEAKKLDNSLVAGKFAKTKKGTAALLGLLSTSNIPRERADAAFSLRYSKESIAQELAAEFRQSPDLIYGFRHQLQRVLISSLAKVRGGQEQLLILFREAHSAESRAKMAKELEGFAPAWPALVAGMRGYFTNLDEQIVKHNCAAALVGNEEVHEELADYVRHDPNSGMALAAIRGLKGSQTLIDLFEALLEHCDLGRRLDFLCELAGDAKAKDLIESAIRNHEDIEFFDAGVRALGRTPEATENLLSLLKDCRSWKKKVAIIKALEGHEGGEQELLRLLNTSRNPVIKAAACSSLQGHPKAVEYREGQLFLAPESYHETRYYEQLFEFTPAVGTILLRSFIRVFKGDTAQPGIP